MEQYSMQKITRNESFCDFSCIYAIFVVPLHPNLDKCEILQDYVKRYFINYW
jgi:hypothetical protein